MKQIHFVSNIMAYIIIYCKIKILGLPTYRLLTVNDVKIVLGRKKGLFLSQDCQVLQIDTPHGILAFIF